MSMTPEQCRMQWIFLRNKFIRDCVALDNQTPAENGNLTPPKWWDDMQDVVRLMNQLKQEEGK